MGSLFSTIDYDPETEVPDLTEKVVLVTGGSSGIGYETVKLFVKKGAKVYMGARNESRATGAIGQLKAEGILDSSKGSVIWLPLDLAIPRTTTAGAQDFMRRESRLDVLGFLEVIQQWDFPGQRSYMDGYRAYANLQKTFMTLGPVLGRLAVMLSKLFFIEPSKGA
ncbi:hypothetical protein FRB98_002557 [Tulasnella sp. 332]|nr:hypothetical protein FRB98_002557 [Tulasnella sp. 332]